MYIVAVGNPFDGSSFYGPFLAREDALEWAELLHHEWWILTLHTPDDDE